MGREGGEVRQAIHCKINAADGESCARFLAANRGNLSGIAHSDAGKRLTGSLARLTVLCREAEEQRAQARFWYRVAIVSLCVGLVAALVLR